MLRTGKELDEQRCRDETGSVIVALIVIVVVALGLLAVFANVNSSLNLTRNDQNRTNAFQLANAGMDQALYRIDTKSLPSVPSGTYQPLTCPVAGLSPCPAGTYAGYTENLTVGGSNFDITATKTPVDQSRTWTVRATGTDASGRKRRVVATIAAETLFPDAFFTDKAFGLTGNQDSPEAYRSSVCLDPRGRADSPCVSTYPIPGRLGTNGTISGSSSTASVFRTRWSGFNMYGRTNQADADEACMDGACGTAPVVSAVTNRKVLKVPATPGNTPPCPNGGIIGTSGTTTTVQAGDYVCDRITLRGTIVVGGTGTVRIWAKKSISVSSRSVVNRAQVPARFQLFLPQQDGNSGNSSSICNSELWALLYTPGLTIDCNGQAQPEIFGAVVAEEYQGTGSNFAFHWDMEATDATSTGRYVIKDWRECPATANDC